MNSEPSRGHPPSYLFVGPPEAGKTVFFACAMDLLQRKLLEKPKMGFFLRPENDATFEWHNKALGDMGRGKWPDKTQSSSELSYLLEETWRLLGIRLWTKRSCLAYLDYPGEVFDYAFGRDRQDIDHFSKEADELRDRMRQAKGMFLMIDTPNFHSETNNTFIEQIFRFLESVPKDGGRRIAVVFTKRDLFHCDPEFNPEELLKERSPTIWLLAEELKARFFFVSAVAQPFLDRSGRLLPAKDYRTSESEELVSPLAWVLGIPL